MKFVSTVAAALCAGFSLAAAAQSPAPAAKVAVVAFQQAVAQTNEFQRSFGDLQKKYTPRRDQLKTLSDEIDSLKKQLQSTTLSQADRASRTRAIDDKQKELQRSAQEAQTDFQTEIEKSFNGIATKVGQELIAYSTQQGYTLVLDGGRQETPVVLWATPATDITQALVNDYNVKSGIPAPATPAAAAPAPSRPAGARTGAAGSTAHPAAAH
ncbi:MAG: OmpH family outer membrane protein [Acidobacteriota bacterium]|nr:OmpH family outer membrane protein [Acidobacteriota bacterium]